MKGACRDLCLEAARLGRRRENRVDPEDVPAELDLERWELLEEILAQVPGTEVRDYEAVRRVRVPRTRAGRPGRSTSTRVVERLREEIEALEAKKRSGAFSRRRLTSLERGWNAKSADTKAGGKIRKLLRE